MVYIALCLADGEPAGPRAAPEREPGRGQPGVCHVAQGQVCAAEGRPGPLGQVRLLVEDVHLALPNT